MRILIVVCQVVAACGLLNVWLLRRNKSTPFRGGNAQNMSEEFAAYGLPAGMVILIGTLKVAIAIALIAGIWMPVLVRPAAAALGVLMLGALAMHVRVSDPIVKSLPAAGMLALAALLMFAG